jgi:hypothetical protein
MTVTEALELVRQVGVVEGRGGVLRLKFPERDRAMLQPAIEVLRGGKAKALTLLAQPDPAEVACASALLNRAGVRIMRLDGGFTIGIWSDLDGPEIRTALGSLRLDGLAVRYLDGPGIPMRYKVRTAPN